MSKWEGSFDTFTPSTKPDWASIYLSQCSHMYGLICTLKILAVNKWSFPKATYSLATKCYKRTKQNARENDWQWAPGNTPLKMCTNAPNVFYSVSVNWKSAKEMRVLLVCRSTTFWFVWSIQRVRSVQKFALDWLERCFNNASIRSLSLGALFRYVYFISVALSLSIMHAKHYPRKK